MHSNELTFIYQYLLVRALSYAPATKVGTMNYLSVVFSGILGWWIFHEVPSIWVLVGVVFIIGGGVVALFSKAESRKWNQ